MNLRVISGGQTGADLAGLWAAKIYGVETGGFAPKGWTTQLGPKPQLSSVFGLVESDSLYHDGPLGNCENSGATVIFASDARSPGTKLTIHHCITKHVHYRLFSFSDKNPFVRTYAPCVLQIVRDVMEGAGVINIAGNSTQTSSSAFSVTFATMCAVLGTITDATPKIIDDLGVDGACKKLQDCYEGTILETI